ncbi:MAG: hypothetical protein AAGD00_00095 [Planctomycetota bacterium]
MLDVTAFLAGELGSSPSLFDQQWHETFRDVATIAALAAVGIVWIGFHYWRRASKVKQQEMSRREVAAYVAEGTISADDAQKLLVGLEDSSDAEASIKRQVAEGLLSPKKAEERLRVLRAGRDGLLS